MSDDDTPDDEGEPTTPAAIVATNNFRLLTFLMTFVLAILCISFLIVEIWVFFFSTQGQNLTAATMGTTSRFNPRVVKQKVAGAPGAPAPKAPDPPAFDSFSSWLSTIRENKLRQPPAPAAGASSS